MTKNINSLSYIDFKNTLTFNSLPGVDSQLYMAPPYRAKLIIENKLNNIDEPRVAAILILLYKHNNQWYFHFPMILRNTYKGVHSNQIGFPGGKVEEQDSNLAATAVRETKEEINVEPEDIEILGKMTELYIPPSNFLVHPYVGIMSIPPYFIPCDIEVNKIIHINLADFLLNPQIIEMNVSKNNDIKNVPAYLLPNGVKIWGASAMMLSEFYVFVKKSLNL